jgi:beta-glucosidase
VSGADARFPPGFLWGAATSSHQIEGMNVHNDWWDWEAAGRAAEPSGAACDSWARYEEDFDLARDMHQNAHRFSVEWSRVEPREGAWDGDAVAHYRAVVEALRRRGIEPIVTLHHFTNPRWLARRGGWENPRAVEAYVRYAERMVEALGDLVRFWVTINEPMVYVYHGCLIRHWPPGKASLAAGLRTTAHFARAHCAAYERIHALYGRKGWAAPRVGLAHAIQHLEPADPRSWGDRRAVFIRDRFNNRLFLKLVWHDPSYLAAYGFGTGGRRRALDFIGLNYYFREIIAASRQWKGLLGLCGEVSKSDARFLGSERSDLDWEIYPEGLYRVLLSLKGYGVPIFVTENGLCTSDEGLRIRFIRDHLEAVRRALRDGVPVGGYFYWSLLDNFEWAFGFRPRFGLVHVDYATQKRTLKESGRYYARVCRSNAIAEA